MSLGVYPPGIKELNGDYINYRDTAGYGIEMITESKCNDAEIGKISIKGDTIKAIRYALFYYRKLQEEHEEYTHQLWNLINKLQAENKKAWAEAERIRKAGIKLAQNLTNMYNRDSRNPTKPK